MSSWILIRSVSARICSLLIRCGECTNLSRSSRTDVYYTPSLPKKIREWPRTSPERAIIKWAQEYLEISSFAHELLIFSYRLRLGGSLWYFFGTTPVTLNIVRKKIRRIQAFPGVNSFETLFTKINIYRNLVRIRPRLCILSPFGCPRTFLMSRTQFHTP